MKYVPIGKIVNTHGIWGELRLISHFEFKEKVFYHGMKVYIGRDKNEEVIADYRKHKQYDMIHLEGYGNINEVLKYKGQFCYVNEEDLHLMDDEYLASDLIQRMCYRNGEEIGRVKRVEEISEGRRLLIVDYNGKEVMVPYVKEFVHYDKIMHVITLTVPEGLIQ